MTVLVSNVSTSTDTFGQWVSKTNIIASALSNVVVTTDSNTAVGNAAISGSFTAAALYGNTISGGNTTAAANVTISSNATFTQNAVFTGARTSLGAAANVQINSGNSTFRVLTVNSAASNTLVVTKINTTDLSDLDITSPSSGQILTYNSSSSKWINSNALNVNTTTSVVTFNANIVTGNVTSDRISVGNSTVNVSVNSTMVAVNGSPALLKVYYANNVQAFP